MTGDPGKPHILPQKSSAGSRWLYSHENDFFSVYAITPCLSSQNDLPPQNSGVGFTAIIKNPQFRRKSADLHKTDCSPANHRSPHPLTHNRPRSTQPTAAPIVATVPLKHKRRGCAEALLRCRSVAHFSLLRQVPIPEYVVFWHLRQF